MKGVTETVLLEPAKKHPSDSFCLYPKQRYSAWYEESTLLKIWGSISGPVFVTGSVFFNTSLQSKWKKSGAKVGHLYCTASLTAVYIRVYKWILCFPLMVLPSSNLARLWVWSTEPRFASYKAAPQQPSWGPDPAWGYLLSLLWLMPSFCIRGVLWKALVQVGWQKCGC